MHIYENSSYCREKTGEKVYIMPVGGSDKTGSFGYIEAYNEMLKQGIADKVTDIILANGTGGTMSGLAVANHLAGNSKKIRYVIYMRSPLCDKIGILVLL